MAGLGTILQANNQHRIAKAKYEQARDTQRANNKLKKAQGDLANWSRSLGNRRRIEAAEKEFNRGVEQISHETRQMGKQRTALSLDSAEQRGALLARAAMTGVGGSTVESMENLMALQAATSNEELDQAMEQLVHFGKQNLVTGMMNSYLSQDFSQTMMDFDFTKHVEPQRMKGRLGKLIGVGVATWFGGPQAGDAVANLAVGEWKADNADYIGAMQSFGQAIQGGVSAWDAYSARGTSWGGDVLRGMRATGRGSDSYANITKNASTTNKSATRSKSWFK